nr:nuclear transport factor 2 family protein [Parvularcula maris]
MLLLDGQVFRAAFETCDVAVLKRLMTEDLEFYHDKGGKTDTLDGFIESVVPGCKEQRAGKRPKVDRVLYPETVQVRTLGDWGVMQTGKHGFYGPDEKGERILYETGLFTHLWKKDGDGWKIARVISYDHLPPAK